MRCLKIAESKVENCSNWIECAESWKQELDNSKEAERCIGNAESMAENSHDLEKCAEYWKDHNDDEKNVTSENATLARTETPKL